MTLALKRAETPAGKSPFYHLNAPREDMIGYLTHLSEQGDFLQLGALPAYFVNHPDLVQQVLVTQAKHFHKPRNVKGALKGLVDQNLFSADGETWRILRKAIQPAFHMTRIGAYLDTMVDYTGRMMADWQSGQRIEMTDAIMGMTLASTNKALFNVDMDGGRSTAFGSAVLTFLDHFTDRLTAPVQVPVWMPTRANREIKQAVDYTYDLCMAIIQERKANPVDHGDLLSMLLHAQQGDESGVLTDRQLAFEVQNLAAAGYEVTTFTSTFVLYLIATHREVEARLIAEVDSVLGNRPVTLDTLGQLTYLEQVIKEAMRLLPATTVVTREVAVPVTLAGQTIAKGAIVLVAPYTLHRRPDIFPQPEQFDPERFSAGREADIPKHAYIPFSTGPRICIGNAFAMLQMRAMIATLYQRYRLRVPDDYTMTPIWRFNMRPKDGLPMVTEAR